MGNPRRRRLEALALAVAALLAIVPALSGCGDDDGGGGTSTAADERVVDAEVMNVALSQELTLVQVYEHSLRLLRGEQRQIARSFLGQEKEHIDGITRVLRGLQADAEGEAEEIDYAEVKTAEDAVQQLYESTGLQLRHYIDDVAHLETIAPRALVTTMGANEAQHLVVLRQLLGAGLADSVPEAFDGGEVPSPLEDSEADTG